MIISMADEVINIDNDQEETQRKYKRNYAKYLLDEKKAFGKLVAKYKTEYDDEVKRLRGKTRWDGKRKQHVDLKPKEGYISKSVRNFCADLKNAKHDDKSFRSASTFAVRCHKSILKNTWNDIEDENGKTSKAKKRFRESGGGRKPKAPEVRNAVFEWFLDVRGALKGRLPLKIFLRKC